MLPLKASQVLYVEGIEDDPVVRARAERLLQHISTDEVRTVSDEELNGIMGEVFDHSPRHGMKSDIRPIVIFNRFRLHDPEMEQKRRRDAYPNLLRLNLNGYAGFDWRKSGSAAVRERLGIVCQPAWHIHTVVGCHFRCAYCNLGWYANIMLNLEDYVAQLDKWMEWCPNQRLFQWDNYTDTVCWEPEYGAAKLLVEYFAGRPGQALELYVGKSDNVDFLLDLDHRGHTVCCWSLAARTQSTLFEPVSAPMQARIDAMRKCQDAGYPVRVRLSPIIPVRNWREENGAMLELLFAKVKPDVMTIETIRFLDSAAIEECFDTSLLDEDYLAAMKSTDGADHLQGCELPHEYRKEFYEFFFNEIGRLSPETPIAFCRESFEMWDEFKETFAAQGQTTRKYFCNCGPHCAPKTAGVA
jgi:spore photoproduct lyase